MGVLVGDHADLTIRPKISCRFQIGDNRNRIAVVVINFVRLYASLYLAYIALVVHPDLDLAATMLCLAAPYALVVLLEIGHVGIAALRDAILGLALR